MTVQSQESITISIRTEVRERDLIDQAPESLRRSWWISCSKPPPSRLRSSCSAKPTSRLMGSPSASPRPYSTGGQQLQKRTAPCVGHERGSPQGMHNGRRENEMHVDGNVSVTQKSYQPTGPPALSAFTKCAANASAPWHFALLVPKIDGKYVLEFTSRQANLSPLFG